MKYCAKFYRDFRYMNEVDEIMITYKNQDANLIKYFAICRFSAQTGTKNRHFMPARRLARHCKRVRRRALTITAGAARIR